MKKSMRTICLCLLVVASLASCKPRSSFSPTAAVPLDTAVRHGQLPNGMTYYIRHNAYPEKRADFYIVNKAGAILEEDNQNGLAHFLEHMAFNGLEHFPGKSMLGYLESIGVKFGSNINAMTGTDNTVYMLTDVPLLREGITDSCLLVLHDWSGSILCNQSEIDAERGVITEEWRSRNNGDFRMRMAFMPVMFGDSRYAHRNIIGDMNVVQNFKREELLDFYHKWYRPDLQAVVIVGDFDVDQMEEKVKTLLGAIPAAANPAPLPAFTVPDNKEPLAAIYTDPEIPSTFVTVYHKYNAPKPADKNFAYFRDRYYVKELINTMARNRISDMLQTEEKLPVLKMWMAYMGYGGDKLAFMCSASARPGKTTEAFEMLLTESERIKRHGFLEVELQRAKASLKRGEEGAYAERDKQYSTMFVQAYTNHFLENEPAPDAETMYRFALETLDNITLKEINDEVRKSLGDENVVVTLAAPAREKDRIPTESGLITLMEQAAKAPVAPYVDAYPDKPLVREEPKAGSIVSESSLPQFGATVWTLSNGMRVAFKATDFQNDEITMRGKSKGGASLVSEQDWPATQVFNGVMGDMGLSEFTPVDMKKLLAGKKVDVSVTLSDNAEVFSGYASPQDLETLFQLVYLRFTQPRFDAAVLDNYIDQQRLTIDAVRNEPSYAYRDTLQLMANNRHPHAAPLTKEQLSDITLAQVERVYKDRFCDPGNFTFSFVGNIDVATFKPLVEKYLASLPTVERNETWRDEGIRPPKGKVRNDFRFPMEMPQVKVTVRYTGEMPYSQANLVSISALYEILKLRYTQAIREDKGGTYGVGVRASFYNSPIDNYFINISFTTNEKQADEMIGIVRAELKKIADRGPLASDLAKVKENRLKGFEQALKTNNYWLGTIDSYYWNEVDYSTGYADTMANLTAADVQAVAKTVLSQNNELTVIMRPAK